MSSKSNPLTELASEGLLLVDKPSGPTSHDIVSWARRATGVRKIGHTGTLDPLASGLLILLIGRKFTKMQSQFLKQNKTYLCTARLGVETDTYDSQGEVTSEASWDEIKTISRDNIEQTLEGYTGVSQQTVPPFSAVKRRGKKLYELAREGELGSSQLPSREIEILDLHLTDYQRMEDEKTAQFTFSVECSSGTYIRSLVHDFGTDLKVGASVTSLRRTAIGNMSINDALLCPIFRQN